MANKRIMKCGNSVYAVGEENSDADREEKAQRCRYCSVEVCEYKDRYLDKSDCELITKGKCNKCKSYLEC